MTTDPQTDRDNLISYCLVASPNEVTLERAERLADAYRDAVLVVPSVPVDRERIAAALYRHEWPRKQVWEQALAMDRETFLAQADAVLATFEAGLDSETGPKAASKPVDRAAVLREAADAVQAHPGAIPYRPQLDEDGGFWWDTRDRDAAANLLRRMADEEQQPETDEQRADREETERDHASGNHQYCGVTCEVEFPTEQLRNFILAKGYPGTAGMLDELLRRAAAGLPAPVAEEQPS